ncbi:MAG: pyridoxal phosphate-dependent aminotransferase family protein [Clostridia bacterium]|nr:pyridoxal phosphate-dependent aminotransferase family protein [Clostridia bacterium]
MDLFKKCDELTMVKNAKSAGIYPYFHTLESRQDIVVEMEGKREVMIGSNNYLGLTGNEEVINAAVEATKNFGTGCSGSRFLNGTTTAHVELEKELAEFLQKEDCVTMSTGFQLNLGVISAIAGRNDVVLCDKENHASIYDAIKLSYAELIRYNHNDMEDLEEKLKTVPENKGILIVTDGVFSMSGDICNLPKLVELKNKYGAKLMVDDAHALGILGEHGRGTAEHFGLEDEVDLICGTFSKSLASLGGYCACSHRVAEFIRHNSRPFIFSASITPACVAAARKSLEIIKREPERGKNLLAITDYMRKCLKERNITFRESATPIIPIYTYEPELTLTACKKLFDEGVYVNPVLPPATPVGECLIRTSYTATHTKELMEEAADKIAKVLTELGIIK